jgi:hypothetical protein
MMKYKLVLVVACIPLTACISQDDMARHVRTHAAFDFQCPKDQIEVSHLGGSSYGARGCGQQAGYVVKSCWDADSCTVVQDSESRPVAK